MVTMAVHGAIKFIRSLLQTPSVHAFVRDSVEDRADPDLGHLVGIDHEDGAGVVEYVMLPTTDGGATFTRLVHEGERYKLAVVPNGKELYNAVLDAWDEHTKDQLPD